MDSSRDKAKPLESGDEKKVEVTSPTDTSSSSSAPHQEDGGEVRPDGEAADDHVPDQSSLVPVTPPELAELRAHLASVVATDSCSSSPQCSSYFIEPVEWMEAILLGHVEGKVSEFCVDCLCPQFQNASGFG